MFLSLVLYAIAFVLLTVSTLEPSLNLLGSAALLVLLFGVVLLWRNEGRSITNLGFNRTSKWWRICSQGLLIGFILPFIFIFFQVAAGWILPSRTTHDTMMLTFYLMSTFLRLIVIVAIEEVIFRGYFLQKFSFKFGAFKAVLASSLLWALLHIPNMAGSGLTITQVVIGVVSFKILGIGLGLGFVYNKNTLWHPLGLHFGYNLIFSMYGLIIVSSYIGPELIVGNPAWAPESGIIGLVLSTTILLTVWSSLCKLKKL